MSRPVQDVRVWKTQHRKDKPRPYVVRWVVDSHPHSRSFHTSGPAERYRARLIVARDNGERFDTRGNGEPISWSSRGAKTPVYDWARRWIADEWDEIAPRTRKSYLEAGARLVVAAVPKHAPRPPAETWAYLMQALRPGGAVLELDARERWVRRWGLTLGELDKERMADVDRKLGLGARGQRLAPSTAGRFRKDAKACIRWAVELEQIPVDPWPRQRKGRSRRKANRITQAVDIRRLPAPGSMAGVIAALPTEVQPYAGRTWEVMTAVGYYAGLRPSEVVYLRRQDVHLPDPDPDQPDVVGWGWIEVEQADDGEDNAADPKTGRRVVPIPPHLVLVLRAFLGERPGPADGLLFRTKTGTRPSLDNWRRALRRACRKVDVDPLSPYDLRHACATTWIQAGVPLGEAARRLGHSVQTLVARYIQALTGDETIANERIAAALGPCSSPAAA